MSLTPLNAISPIDGRYHTKTNSLSQYFSEFGLIKYRVQVEIEYFITLCNIPLEQLKGFDTSLFDELRDIYMSFSENDAQKIKEIEKVTNHDVKAVEYFIKEKFEALNIGQYKEFIHFGLTSQDINNTSTPLSLKEGIEDVYLSLMDDVFETLEKLANDWAAIPLLARTHGQPASPTRLGKELNVFLERIANQLTLLGEIPYGAKFGGATGNFNAHHVAYPEIDWIVFGNHFVDDVLGLDRQQCTTQIEHYDNMGALFDNLKRINTILIDLCRDIWTYISFDYFKQKVKEGEVGSSAMPHKVNPIDFENAEGNLGMANAIFEHLSHKLPVSRLQRDLTDSTVLRNIGVPIGHTIIAFQSILKGLNKLVLNQDKINQDLDRNWMVVSEAIQTVLRKEGVEAPYEQLKALTRGNSNVTQETFVTFINGLAINDELKTYLKTITPFNYTGINF